MVNGDPGAMVAALNEHSALGRLPFSVKGLDTVLLNGRIIAIVDRLGREDIPEEIVTLPKFSKTSVNDLAVGKSTESIVLPAKRLILPC